MSDQALAAGWPAFHSTATNSHAAPANGPASDGAADGPLVASEMAARIEAMDWSTTPIGAAPQWSPGLRMMVSFMLANRFPLLLWWGPHYVSIYNDAYRPILGSKHPSALGQPVSEVWSEIWHILKPLIDTPFTGGPSTWSDDLTLEINRHGFLEETHFTVAYSPVPDETAPQGIGGVLATVHEITEKVVGERRVAALRDLGARSSHAKTAEDACAIAATVLSEHPKDIPFALLYLIDGARGEARLAGAAGVQPQSAMSPLTLSLTGSAAWPVAEAMARQDVIIVEHLKRRFGVLPAGPWSEAADSAAIIPVRSNKAGELAAFVVAGISPRLRLDHLYRGFLELMAAQIATSIANARAYEEERERAEALAEIDRAKTAFFSNVSHEFRTPLTLMLGPLENLLGLPAEALPAKRGELTVIHRSGLRLLRLVNMLLDFSRIEAGRVRAAYEPVALAEFTADLGSEFRAATEKAGLRLTLDCAPLAAPVWIDRDMWEKIVLNLLSNAFKFTPKGGITVRLRSDGGNAVLQVEDTGIGIPDEELPHIFDRFHRVQGARGRTHEGTGIGLALVQELAKLHGGTVKVASQLGVGTTFTVTMPLGTRHLPPDRLTAERTLQSTALGAQPYVQEALRWLPPGAGPAAQHDDIAEDLLPGRRSAPRTNHERPTVLIVEDNADMRDYVARLLAPRYRLRTAADGLEALRLIRAERPDLLLSDVMMPRLDGFGLVREVRSDPTLADIPVVLLSARAGEDASVEGLQTGADDYLVKPFNSRELLARVGTNLKMARLRREFDTQLAADLRAMSVLRDVAGLCVGATTDAEQCLHGIIDAAIAVTGAQKANLQLVNADAGALTIAAQRGFEQPFLDFLTRVRDDGRPCAAAMRSGQQVVVEDVTANDIFAGEPSHKAMHDAGVRAVVATPLVSSTDSLLGIISTYFAVPHRPTERELHFLSLLARQAADYLERRQARQTERILLRELQHRSNNLLSVVQSIVHGSLIDGQSLSGAKTALESRLHALARANRQLTSSNWNGLSLSSIVRLELEPFIDRTAIEGAEVILDPRTAQNLSLAFHELATNAAKYGALSARMGKVAVSWTVRRNGKHDLLRIGWRESGGPPVVTPTNKGFGTSLLKAICADVRFDFAGAGLTCHIEVPLDARGAASA